MGSLAIHWDLLGSVWFYSALLGSLGFFRISFGPPFLATLENFQGSLTLFPYFNMGSVNPKSAMLASRPQIDEKCLKNQKKFGYIFSNSKFFKFLVMNYETHSSQMCRRLEIILS